MRPWAWRLPHWGPWPLAPQAHVLHQRWLPWKPAGHGVTGSCGGRGSSRAALGKAVPSRDSGLLSTMAKALLRPGENGAVPPRPGPLTRQGPRPSLVLWGRAVRREKGTTAAGERCRGGDGTPGRPEGRGPCRGQLPPWAPPSHRTRVAVTRSPWPCVLRGPAGPMQLPRGPRRLVWKPSLAGFPRSHRCQAGPACPCWAPLPGGSSDRAAAGGLAWVASRAHPLPGYEWGRKGSCGWQWPTGSGTGLGDCRAVAKGPAAVGVRRGRRPRRLPGTPFSEPVWCLRAEAKTV